MTEKRYYLEDFKDFTVITLRLYDRKIKHKHYDWLTESHKIVDLLNELDEKYVDEFSLRETLQQELQRVEKENEQLKSTINEVTELLSEEVDLFSDKATEHDINAYVELNELDNKDAYYMATATKKAILMLKELQE